MEPLDVAALNQLYLQAVEHLRQAEDLIRRLNDGSASLPAPESSSSEYLSVLNRFLTTPHREIFAAIGKVGEIAAPKLWRYPQIRDLLTSYLGSEADEGHLRRVLAELAEWGLIDLKQTVPDLGVTVPVVRFTPVGARLYTALMAQPPQRFVTAPPPVVAGTVNSAPGAGSPSAAVVPAPAAPDAPSAPSVPPARADTAALQIPVLTEEQQLALRAVGASGYSRVAELARFPGVMEAFMQGGQVRDDLFSLRINDLKRMRLLLTHPRITTGARGHAYAPIELSDLGREAYRHYCQKEPVPSEIPALENRFKSLAFAYFVRDVYRLIKEKGWSASMDQEDTLITLPIKPPDGKGMYTIRMSIVSRNNGKTFYHKCFMSVPEDRTLFRFLTRYRLLTREFYLICPNQALMERLIAGFERWTQQVKPDLCANLEANFTTLEGLKKERPWTRLTPGTNPPTK